MEERLKRLSEECLELPKYRNGLFPPSPYYKFFRMYAFEVKPKVMVELGVCGGGGSLHMALGNPEGKVIGVDFQWDHPEHINYISGKYKNFTFLLDDSVKAAPKIYKQYGEIDLLFVDTDHTYERTLAEYKAYLPYMSKSGVMMFDDLFRPGMEQAWNEIKGDKLRLDFLHPGQYPEGGGFGVVWNLVR